MSTPSNIVVEHKDGMWRRVYCHFDGYINGVGAVLLRSYNSQELAEAVVRLGDISSLEDSCEKPKGHSFDHPVKGYTVYYSRDAEEKTDVDGVIGPTLAEVWPDDHLGTEYVYVWRRGSGWWVGRPSRGEQRLVLLTDLVG